MQNFGKYGYWLKKIARGEDTSLVSPSTQVDVAPKSIGHSYTLEHNITNPKLLQAWVRLLCERVACRLRSLLLAGSVVHFYLRGSKHQWWVRQKKFAQPTFDGQCLYQRCLFILDSLFPHDVAGLNIRALGVSVSGLIPAPCTYLFEQDKKRQTLLFALDQINRRFGEWSIYPANLTIINREGA